MISFRDPGRIITWQEQAREFIAASKTSDAERARLRDVFAVDRPDRGEVLGAIAGLMANNVVQRLFGGPGTDAPTQWIHTFAQGCHAFLAAYEAETPKESR